MSNDSDALGGLLKEALSQAQKRPKGLENELQGWTKIDFDLPSLHYVEEMYRKSMHLAKGDPMSFLGPVAKADPGFREQREFTIKEQSYCGFYMFREVASFFLVFGIRPRMHVKLYYMGHTGVPDETFKAACSKLALTFDGRLSQFYFSFQKNLLDEPSAT